MKYYRVPQLDFEGETFPETFYEIREDKNYGRVLRVLPGKLIGSTFPEFYNPFTEEIEITVPEWLFHPREDEIGEEIPEELIAFTNEIKVISFCTGQNFR